MLSLLPDSLLHLGYISAFTSAALLCFFCLPRINRIADPDTRRGLFWLLALSGAWSLSHVGYLLPIGATGQYIFYIIGLVIGIAAVGPWLYFCSAYSGRTLHRNRMIRLSALGGFLAIIGVKLTNPLHNLYFRAEPAVDPFAHLAIHHEPLHWVVMGTAYALAIVGFFVLFELFMEVSFDTRPLLGLVLLTGLPVAFDVGGVISPLLLDITHSPLGVAVFAVGVLFVYIDRFQSVQLAGESDNAVLLLDGDNRLWGWNQSAETVFPNLAGAERDSLESIIPSLAAALENTDDILPVQNGEGLRQYRVTTNAFSADKQQLGQLITLADVTEEQRYRQRIEDQNERLEHFASVVSHDLRNPLNVAEGRLSLARESGDLEHLEPVERAHARMHELIEDLLRLARSGVAIDDTEIVAVAALATECWEMIESKDATLTIDPDLSIELEADRERLRQVFENLFRNAVEHGGEAVTIRIGELPNANGFFIEDDGPGIPEDIREEVIKPGFTTNEGGTGFGLSIVAEIIRAHQWDLAIAAADSGGARFEIRHIG